MAKELFYKMKNIPLSDNSIKKRRIDGTGDDLQEQVLNALKKCSCFAIQIDETTDVRNMAHIICYCRFFDLQSQKLREEIFILYTCGNENNR